MGCGILPHLKNMVEIIENGLEDEQQKVRTITALGKFSKCNPTFSPSDWLIELYESIILKTNLSIGCFGRGCSSLWY